MEFSYLDGQCFQIFLDNLPTEEPEHLNVVQLDNGKFYHSSQLKIPDNILLVFQPPYTPELKPSERVGQYIKQELSWGLYDNLDEIKEKVRSFLEKLSTETIASIAGWDYLRSAIATLCIIWEKWYYS